MSSPPSPPPIRVATVGAGAISQSQHVPGLQLDPRAELVMVCDADPQRAYSCQLEWGAKGMTTDFREVCRSPDVDALKGVPATVFRYDVVWEFLSAIRARRRAVPAFYDGLAAQIVADAVLQSHQERGWVAIPPEPRG